MQALSSYKPDVAAKVERDLSAFDDLRLGLRARPHFSERGLFAKFVWPDWPESASRKCAEEVDRFRNSHPELRLVPSGVPEWAAVFRDWRSDSESARVIGEAFSKHFTSRFLWAESERDARGRIVGGCYVEGLDKTALHLFWKDSSAIPDRPIPERDRDAFQSSVRAVFDWAGSRIRPILDALHDKLSALYGDRFRGLYLFGSYARPDAGIQLPIDSDLDVALILSDFENYYEERERYGDIVADLSLEHSLAISVIPIRETDYKERRTSFARVISKYAVPVA